MKGAKKKICNYKSFQFVNLLNDDFLSGIRL